MSETRKPEPNGSVAYEIADAAAKQRLLAVLASEHLTAVPVEVEPLASGVRRIPTGLTALVHDLAPWTGEATAKLEGLRRRAPDLPYLLYVPVRPETAPLLLQASALRLVWALLQIGGPEETARLRDSLRRLLDGLPGDAIMRQLRVFTTLPPEAQEFCRLALRALERASGEALTVRSVAERLGTDRRTLERTWRAARVPSPGEILDWTILMYVTWACRGHEERLPAVALRIGLDPRRVRRIQQRLHVLGHRPFGTSAPFDQVLSAFTLRTRELHHGLSVSVSRRTRRKGDAPPLLL